MLHKSALFHWALLILIYKKGQCCDGEGWLQNDGNCYKIFAEKANKSVAETTCLEVKSALASISNVTEHTFLTTQIGLVTNSSEENYWIGLHKIGNDLLWNSRISAKNVPWVDTSSSTGQFSDCFIFNGAKVLPQDCSQEASFICEKWKDMGRIPGSCPRGTYKDMISDKCFWYTHMPLSKAGSEVLCSLKRGKLLTMNGAFFPLNIALVTTANPPPPPAMLWTSLTFTNGTVRYVDGTEFEYGDLRVTLGGEGECLALVVEQLVPSELLQMPCLRELQGFCEIDVDYLTSEIFTSILGPPMDIDTSDTKKPSCPHGSNWQEHPETGFCYWETSYETTRLSWADARKYCQSYGGDLASFHSIREEKIGLGFLSGTVEHSYWIGLYYDLNRDTYLWADGTPMDYTNWDEGQPSHSDRRMRCGYMSSIRKKWSLSYCGRLSWFICKAPKQINPQKPVVPTAEPLIKCSEDSSGYFFNDYCYEKISVLHSWHRAQQYCENHSSNLVSLHSEDEVDFIIRLMSGRPQINQGNRLWIGLNALDFRGSYKWTDGSPVDFTNWDVDEPNNFLNQEKCTSMYIEHGMWNDENCNAVMSFICKRRNGTIPDTTTTTTVAPELGYCPDDFYMFGDRCFRPFGEKETERKNWTEAGLHCLRMGGFLASVRNSKDQAFMYYLMQNLKADTWIGLHDSIHSGVFYWTDNSPLTYTKWAIGEPSSFGFQEDCAAINYGLEGGGTWEDTKCNRVLPYVCQVNRDPKFTNRGTAKRSRCPYSDEYLKQGLSCYKVFSDLKSWEEAETLCANEHGHLVSVFDKEAQAVVNYLAAASFNQNDTFWIGLKYTGSYPLKWVNGWPMAFSKWGRNEPNPTGTKDTCFSSTVSGYWKGESCSEKKPFICHINAGNPPPTALTPIQGECPTRRAAAQWREVGKTSCMLFDVRSSVEWHTANFRCFYEGANLASLHSMAVLEELQMYFMGPFSHHTVFIGLTRNSEGGFDWVDESPVDFVNWDEGEPRDVSHKCVQMKLDTMKWSVVPCNIRQYYMCGKEKDNMVFVTSSPPLNDTFKGTVQEKQVSSSGMHPGAVAAIVVSLIALGVVAAAIVLLRFRPWKSDWNRYRVREQEGITSFENETYADEMNNIDIHDRHVLYAKH